MAFFFFFQMYTKALDIVVRTAGELNVKATRLYLNIGIHWELKRDYEKAFDFFYKWFEVCRDLYGEDHPRTSRPLETLYEYLYQRIAHKRKIKLPKAPAGARLYFPREETRVDQANQDSNVDGISIASSID